jgi:hypothetical protein
MHGLNPRLLLGQDWWDRQRHAAYAKRNFHCWACGIPRRDAVLEGHEEYEVNYEVGRMTFLRVVALCPLCHSFVHSGRLTAKHRQGKLDGDTFKFIITHGLDILERAGLLPWPPTVEMVLLEARSSGWRKIGNYSIAKLTKLLAQSNAGFREPSSFAEWGLWRLVIDGREFEPIYKSMAAWAKAYSV